MSLKERLRKLLQYEAVSTWRHGFKLGGDALAYKRWIEQLQELVEDEE